MLYCLCGEKFPDGRIAYIPLNDTSPVHYADNRCWQCATPRDILTHAIGHLSSGTLGVPEIDAKKTLSLCLGKLGFGRVQSVLGEERTSSYFFGDGSFDCPFCSNPIVYPQTVCTCPFCIANPFMSVQSAQSLVDKANKETREREEREWNHRQAMQRIREDREQNEREIDDTIRYARTFGACIQCLAKSRYRKFIVHRAGYTHAA